jgi:hypothetical protein
MDKHTPWNRLLGMALTDLLTGRPGFPVLPHAMPRFSLISA